MSCYKQCATMFVYGGCWEVLWVDEILRIRKDLKLEDWSIELDLFENEFRDNEKMNVGFFLIDH
jgi:hypothetical protein